MPRFRPLCKYFIQRLPPILVGSLLALLIWTSVPTPSWASIHTYRERPGQVTVRSRLSLRDSRDRAWQAIAFKRTQNEALQGVYLRLVGFPDAVAVDRQQPITLLAPTGQQWQLRYANDPQTQSFPANVGQYNAAPLLGTLTTPVPLEMQVPLLAEVPAEFAIAPFIVKEWLAIKTTVPSPAPIAPPAGKES